MWTQIVRRHAPFSIVNRAQSQASRGVNTAHGTHSDAENDSAPRKWPRRTSQNCRVMASVRSTQNAVVITHGSACERGTAPGAGARAPGTTDL